MKGFRTKLLYPLGCAVLLGAVIGASFSAVSANPFSLASQKYLKFSETLIGTHLMSRAEEDQLRNDVWWTALESFLTCILVIAATWHPVTVVLVYFFVLQPRNRGPPLLTL